MERTDDAHERGTVFYVEDIEAFAVFYCASFVPIELGRCVVSTVPLNVQKEKEKVEEEKKNESGRSGSSKGNWIRKLGNYSPSKYQAPSGPTRTNTMRPLDTLCNSYEQISPAKTLDSPKTPSEMPDLESIIREFETGFLSPTKSPDTSMELYKQKNFVKKIVAAFEVKYKSYSDLKAAQEANEHHDDCCTRVETPRRTNIIDNEFKSNYEESKQRQDAEDSGEVKNSRRSGIFGSPFKVSIEEIKVPESNKPPRDGIKKESGVSKDRGEKLKNRKKSLFGSSRDSSSSSEIYSHPVDVDCQEPRDSSSDSSYVFKFDEKVQRSNFLFNPLNVPSLDDTITMDGIDLDLTLPEPEETILLEEDTLPKTSTMINEHPNYTDDDDDCFIREISKVDRTPKIVGAFLKEPIEVEDTSIDWIPITGKKLPRKRSLKKLLNALTGKKSLEKRSKLFSSERNLYEEPRELQDSGYDEKSCSSSSLNSLISITEVLLQQENSYMEAEKRGGCLTTFKPRNSTDEEEEDEVFSDTYRCIDKRNRKRLMLTEVPRNEVKVDLGPAYPPFPKFFTKSLDRKMISKKIHSPSPICSTLTRLPKHPHLSTMPKHPFVSMTKIDEPRETPNSQETHSNEEPSVIVKNDLYEVEFRRSCLDVCSLASCRSSSSAESNYDVPRRFLSKSENELRLNSEGKQKDQPVYDVPRSTVLERPKSTGYEDIVSLKRHALLQVTAVPSFYAVPRELEVRYATVKSRNSSVYLSNNILRSMNDLTINEMRSAM